MLGQAEEALPVLSESMQHDNLNVRLDAINEID